MLEIKEHALYKTLQVHPSLTLLNLDYNKDIAEDTIEKLKKIQDIKPQLTVSLKRMFES